MSTTNRSIGKHLAGEAETRWRSMPPVTPGMESRARLAVAGAARDAADCRLLLDMLGLLNEAVRDAA